jgi:hypothetical protein
MSNVGKGVHRRIVMEKEYVEAWEVESKEVVTWLILWCYTTWIVSFFTHAKLLLQDTMVQL